MKQHRDSCHLCGLPLPANPPRLGQAEREWLFCCDSCKQIYQMLHQPPPGGSTANPAGKETGHG